MDRNLGLRAVGKPRLCQLRDRPQRIFMYGASGNIKIGNCLVEKTDEHPHDAAFRLSFLAEKEHVVSGENRQYDFWGDRILIANDSRKEWFTRFERANHSASKFFLYRNRLPS